MSQQFRNYMSRPFLVVSFCLIILAPNVQNQSCKQSHHQQPKNAPYTQSDMDNPMASHGTTFLCSPVLQIFPMGLQGWSPSCVGHWHQKTAHRLPLKTAIVWEGWNGRPTETPETGDELWRSWGSNKCGYFENFGHIIYNHMTMTIKNVWVSLASWRECGGWKELRTLQYLLLLMYESLVGSIHPQYAPA